MRAIDLIKVESKDIKWLTDNLRSGVITVDDSYQRKYIWQPKDQIALIETVLLGYPIPEIYLWANDTNPDTGETMYSIVDGQQRLKTIQRFLNNEFKLTRSGIDNLDADYLGKSFSELTPERKREFWRYQFSSRFINESLSKEEIAKLFLRLNRTSTTLNPQELRNAEFNGLFLKLAAEIAQHDFWTDYCVFTKTDIRRMQDIQFISTLLIFIRMGIEQDNSQRSINKAYDQYNENYPEADDDRALVNDILGVMNTLISGRETLTSVIKKKGHLYYIFVISYHILNLQTIRVVDTTLVANKLEEFFIIYENNNPDNTLDLVEEYRDLSQEGSKKSHNRQRRFEILKEFCF
ncbi:hypothetical protein C9I87_02915 [Photobacterium iliopiscarium]|uniref:DUF262 domain-containing protein n=1 Tax=Photobacterium iliopiscarium TaxID=56192 RepID=UPI000D1793AE|nr:DUF262 domain-containing protein [Photobacterium iliopiscarium]PST96514.1 hypothetical protein C9I87_02915 [Photobacterium iliopiscarium]